MKSVCVYCGSSFGTDPAYLRATQELARTLAANELRVVYGGAAVGLMGALADATLEAGGEVVGVLPQQLMDREIAHQGLTELHVVATMHERKALMAQLSDAFVALPGGIGTLEELIEVFTWSQLGLHAKPLGVLNVAGLLRPARRVPRPRRRAGLPARRPARQARHGRGPRGAARRLELSELAQQQRLGVRQLGDLVEVDGLVGGVDLGEI